MNMKLDEISHEELDNLIQCQETIVPASRNLTNDIKNDILKFLRDRDADINNILNYNYTPHLCGCLGAAKGYNKCHCVISNNIGIYKYHIAKELKDGAAKILK